MRKLTMMSEWMQIDKKERKKERKEKKQTLDEKRKDVN